MHRCTVVQKTGAGCFALDNLDNVKTELTFLNIDHLLYGAEKNYSWSNIDTVLWAPILSILNATEPEIEIER